ncbi:MAG: ComEC/Rec2 family competence protein [Patescibacteria group bacterium]|jgi:competence protein ComEC|nr:ComEC/Rec2 family competence protein [Patescibacteria group bacterium]
MKYSLFYYLASFWLGLFLQQLQAWKLSLVYLILVVLLLVVFRCSSRMRFSLLLVFFFVLGIYRSGQFHLDKSLSLYWQQQVTWSFWVCQDPEFTWKNQKIVLCTLSELGVGNDRIVAYLPLYPHLQYADILTISCRLEAVPVFSDFNYAAYLSLKNISSVCSWPRLLQKQQSNLGSFYLKQIFVLRKKLRQIINQGLPEPAAGLANALLLGYKQSLSPVVKEDMRKAGLSHLTAISGAHIAIILYLLINFLIFLAFKRQAAWWLSLLILLFYVILTGFQTSTIRAWLMGFLAFYVWQRGRVYQLGQILAFVAALMLYHQPLIWRYDVAFQLSFGAILGIIIFQPLFYQIFNLKHKKVLIKLILEALFLSISAQLLIVPILVNQFHSISLLAPISNVMAFFVLAPIMISVLGALLLSSLFSLSLYFWWPSYLLLEYLIALAHVIARWSFAYIDNLKFSMIDIIVYYFILALFYLLLRKIKTPPSSERGALFR